MAMNKLLIGALSVSVLAGCQTLSKEECTGGNWFKIGYADGASGHTLDRLGSHQEACNEYKIVIDREPYHQGREAGLREQYCRPARGVTVGANGSKYHGVCPKDLEGGFLDGLEYGYRIHTQTKLIRDIENEISRQDKELAKIEKSIRETEADLKYKQNSPDVVAKLVELLKYQAEDRGKLKQNLADLDYDLEKAKQELEALNRHNPYH